MMADMRRSFLMPLLLFLPLALGTVSIISDLSTHRAGYNITLTCNTDRSNPTYSWTTTFQTCDGNDVSTDTQAIDGCFIHGHTSGDHTCSDGANTDSYSVDVQGIAVWYNNPEPGRLLVNNIAIAVHGQVNELRCYSGDTTTDNDNTNIVTPTQDGSLPFLSFTSVEAGFLRKDGSSNIDSITNGVYTCQYNGEELSFAVYSRSREDSISLAVQSVDHSVNSTSEVLTVNCVSTGWPATVVQWTKDGTALTSDDTNTISQVILDRTASTYNNILEVKYSELSDIPGLYECSITCTRHNDDTIDTAQGSISIDSAGDLTVAITTIGSSYVGDDLTLNCSVSKLNVAPNITWSKDDNVLVTSMNGGVTVGGVIEDEGGVSRLLTLGPLKQSHAGTYTCSADENGSIGTGTTTVTVDVPSVGVTVETGGTYDHSSSIILTCTVSMPASLEGTVTSITWTLNGASVTSSNDLVMGKSTIDMSELAVADGGVYVCTAVVTSDHIDIDSNITVSNETTIYVQMPDIVSTSFQTIPNNLPTIYSGTVLQLQFIVTLDSAFIINDPDTSVVLTWLRNGVEIMDGGRISITDQSSFGTTAIRQIAVVPILQTDSDTYGCTVSITATANTLYVTNNISETFDFMVNVEAPVPVITMTSTSLRLPDHSDYNQATITCTAVLPLFDSHVTRTITVDKVFSWTENGASIVGTTPTEPKGIESVSTYTTTYDTAGPVEYTCNVSIALDEDPLVSSQESLTITVTGASVPLAATTLTASDVRYNRATINWVIPSIAYTPEQYRIQYGLASDILDMESDYLNSSANFTTTNEPFSLTIKDLMDETTYYYLIKSTNTQGTNNSEVMSFVTPSKPPTAPPSGFVITSVNATSLSMDWSPPPLEDRNGDITNYTLTCFETVGGEVMKVATPQFPITVETDDALTLNGFRPGTFINCSVTASNAAGMGPPAFDDITTDEQPPGGPPLDFVILNSGSRAFTVMWSAPDPLLQYGVILGYTLTCSESNSNVVPDVFPVMLPHPPSNTEVNELKPFTEYQCSLVAYNSAGDSPTSSDTAMTEQDAPDGAPRDFSVTAHTSRTITLQWLPVLPSQQNGLIMNYSINCNDIFMFESVDDTIEMSDDFYSHTLSELTPGTVYVCTVAANTTEGAGPVAMVTVTTLEEAPESPPSDITVSAESSTLLLVEWATPLQPNGIITQYRIYIINNDTSLNVAGDQLQYSLSPLEPYQNVSLQMSAFTSEGEGPRSPVITNRTLEAPPGEIQDIEYRFPSALQVIVTFPEQPPSVANGVIVTYTVSIVRYDNATGSSQQETLVSPSDAVNGSYRVDFDGTVGMVPYNLTLYASNGAGTGAEFDTIIFTLQGIPPPPDGVRAERISDTEILVTWTPINILEARGHISNYTIYYTAQLNQLRQTSGSVIVPANASSATISGLDPTLDYRVTVSASTDVGRGNDSDEAIAMTIPTEVPNMMSLGVIIAIVVVGVVILVTLCVLVILIAVCARRRNKSAYSASDLTVKSPFSEKEELELKAMGEPPVNNAYAHIEDMPTESIPIAPVPLEERMKPIPRSGFSKHVMEMHRDRDKGFEIEYQSLVSNNITSHDVASQAVNRPKNRFANIFPYDFSRVPLLLESDEDGSDYINASYMDGYNKPNAYIAAQGPLPNTIGDFWRMIWEHRLDTIVMLTKCIEGGKRKCESYWPDKVNEIIEKGNIKVMLVSITPYADFEMRKFHVNKGNDNATPLEVTHWHYLGWPDHGVPQYATSLINFIRHVRKAHKKGGPPMVVHCSAGVGRTGTFILLDSMLERLNIEETLNVYEFLRQMRTKRVFMVQTLAQYVFIHDALDELITCGETDIGVLVLKEKIKQLHNIIPGKGTTGFESQYQLLNSVCRTPSELDCSDALQHYNSHKNRYPDRLPYNLSRTRLRPTGAQGSDYINASFIDGYKVRNAYIATQGPLQSTVHDFWRMIWEFSSKAIVLLCNTDENGVEMCYMFWPTRIGEPLQFNKLIVTLQSEDRKQGYLIRKLEIKEDKPQSASFVVTLFHYTEWAEHSCPTESVSILTLLENLNKVQRTTGNKPITVVCNDGMGRSGTFITLHAQQDRIKMEGALDIFHFIKSARIQRPRLVTEMEQFICAHQILSDYYDKFDVYSNFK